MKSEFSNHGKLRKKRVSSLIRVTRLHSNMRVLNEMRSLKTNNSICFIPGIFQNKSWLFLAYKQFISAMIKMSTLLNDQLIAAMCMIPLAGTTFYRG